jgi:eukaryotic-like serine/threonine-protein kinase
MFRLSDTIEFNNDEYVIEKFLGEGGMCHVFSIANKNNGSKRALKSHKHFIPNADYHRSLLNEWDKAKTISHPNVIKYFGIHDGLSEPKIPYLITELANGGTLKNYLGVQNDFLNEKECLTVFHQIIDGMEAINSILIHRDIKPDNILIENGLFKISDFGLAKIASEKTRTKTFKGWGTEPYIAPEAYKSEKNTIQMDMYSIGHVFYNIAGLKHAYGTPSDWEKAHFFAVAEPVNKINPNISPKIAIVINKLINKKPEDRYKTWDDLRVALNNSIDDIGDQKNLVNNILQKKLVRDMEAMNKLSAKQIEEESLKKISDLIDFQFENEIIQPIKEFIINFNKVSGLDSKMTLSRVSKYEDIGYQVLFDNRKIEVWLHKINSRDILTRLGNNEWGETKQFIVKPMLNGKNVLAWGGIETANHSGFNVILVEGEGGYGDWFVLTNKHSALFNRQKYNDQRPDPFVFSSDELVKEIHNVNIMHIYEIRSLPLKIENIIEFISDVF